jgi:hypothetical protein
MQEIKNPLVSVVVVTALVIFYHESVVNIGCIPLQMTCTYASFAVDWVSPLNYMTPPSGDLIILISVATGSVYK